MNKEPSVAIIGAGPAGLTAAYLLCKKGVTVTVLEADSTYVGGISRTARYKGFHFDIGGHRFFSKSKEVEDFWTEILPDDMLQRPRSSRIFYRGKFFAYPLQAREALFKLGVLEATLCVLSYMKARIFPVRNPRSFEDWVSNQSPVLAAAARVATGVSRGLFRFCPGLLAVSFWVLHEHAWRSAEVGGGGAFRAGGVRGRSRLGQEPADLLHGRTHRGVLSRIGPVGHD